MASKRRIRRNKCTGKKQYKSEQEARAGVSRSIKHGMKHMLPYKCEFCKQFHIGGYVKC
jgi:hypothetical protein